VDNYPPRNSPELESSTPYREWYSMRIRRKMGCWGPSPRLYPVIPHFDQLSPSWKRQRVLAVACGFIGLPYQHHHIPDWNPPRSWPWKPVKYGRNSKGVDCSDFTSWCYNFGLGIKLSTGIRKQAEATEVPLRGEGGLHVRTIRNDKGYEDFVSKLKAGDLLYIRNSKGNVGHVIMWVGEYGVAPKGIPIVIDSTGPDHIDSNGQRIPIGVQLRPFTKDGWYFKNLAHAHRIITD
jgi:NlpC/P60 family